MTNQEIVDQTSLVLRENKKQWEDVYAKHIQIIKDNAKSEDLYLSKYCQINSPLTLYSSISKAKSESVIYDLRFAGKSIGTITLKGKTKKEKALEKDKPKYKALLLFSNGQINTARTLKYNIPNKKEEWDSENATKFRSHFIKELGQLTANQLKEFFKGGKIGEEARLESLILNELRRGKKTPHITPVLLDKAFYQLTTPLAASNHYEPPRMTTNPNFRGGGIDILARITHGSNKYGNRLAVIELKDANKKSKAKNAEPQSVVLQQAIEYATFLAHLLCSKSGDDWWNNFKDKGKNKDQQTVPSELHIDAISLMPEGNSEEGDLETVLEVKGLGKKIYIHPYSLYFEKDNKGNPTRFFGTLINEINK